MARQRFLDLHRHLPSATFVAVVALVVAAVFGIFIYAGVYNIGADAPHSSIVYRTLEALRDRAVIHHASGISPPTDLNDHKRIATGAGLYAEMCSACHLAPGMEKTEISQGLYPPAPVFARGFDRTPAEAFWVIKHGVKLSAMPAWGKTHNDTLIWDMVAFARQLPSLSPEQYQAIVNSAPADHDTVMKDMPAMKGAAADHHGD